MANYDTTATFQFHAFLDQTTANSPGEIAPGILIVRCPTGVGEWREIVSFRMPSQPSGADSIYRVKAVLTTEYDYAGGSGSRNVQAHTITKLWKDDNATSGTATWGAYQYPNLAWSTAGGDFQTLLDSATVTGGYGSSFAWDCSTANLAWGQNISIIFHDAGAGAAKGYVYFGSTATVAWKPHLSVTFVDNPPAAITDLTISPDLSLSEASYTYRQRGLLKWTAAKENDFARYRIRSGINRSLAANMTHRAFISSRGSTTYLDPNLYTDSSTIYYAIYVEDTRNQSASTNALISNIISWKKPDFGGNGLASSQQAGTLNVLQQITAWIQPSDTTIAGRGKFVWGDGGYTISNSFTTTGASFVALHRYSKATATMNLRAQNEDIYGFRSRVITSVFTVSNLGPIARLVASPSRHTEMRQPTFRHYLPESYGPSASGREYDLHLERRHPYPHPTWNPVFNPTTPADVPSIAAGYQCPCGEKPPHTVLTDLARYEDIARLLFVEHLKITLDVIEDGDQHAGDCMDKAWFISRAIDQAEDAPDVEEGKLLDSLYTFELFNPDSVIDRESFRAFVAHCRKRGVTPSLERFLSEAKGESAYRL